MVMPLKRIEELHHVSGFTFSVTGEKNIALIIIIKKNIFP